MKWTWTCAPGYFQTHVNVNVSLVNHAWRLLPSSHCLHRIIKHNMDMIYLTTGHTKWSQPDHTFHFFDLVGSKSKKGYHTILISLDNFSRTLGYHCIEVYTFVPELSSFELFKGPADERSLRCPGCCERCNQCKRSRGKLVRFQLIRLPTQVEKKAMISGD